ncbi:MAG: T9SS type A sorting domain-containing protein [Bacteroidales bacterium]|nr:T9SS type A sorting domain-containing protein [Bacteroidales bacterium]
MKKLLLFTAAILFGFATMAQVVIYEDDFESYTTGDYLAAQSADWTTWSNAPGSSEDAFISEDQAQSPIKSVLVEGSSDLVKPLGNKTSGKYEISFGFFVPATFGGYYNLQHFESPGVEWAMEVYFGSDGNATVHAGGENAAAFTFNLDEWIDVQNIVDLNNDAAELWINGTFIHGWQFSLQSGGDPGTLQLGGVNLYAGALTGDTPKYYFDDFLYQELPNVIYEDDFESYNVGDYLAVESEWWDTWSGTPGSSEDALISDEQSHSTSQSVKVDGSTDLILLMGDRVSGQYQVDFYYYVPTGYAGYYNFQHFETPGVEWAFEVYFTETGDGFIHAGGENAAFFTYNHDEWVLCSQFINLDDDWTELYIGGNLIHEWQWSLQAQGDPGTNQLGGIDIFAGAPTGETPLFYMDDIIWTELSSSSDPNIAVTPANFTEIIDQGTIVTDNMNIENTGSANLDFDLEIIYNIAGDKSIPQNEATNIGSHSVMISNLVSEDPSPQSGGAPAPSDDVILNYDGDNASAIGLSAPGIWQAAAKFMNVLTLPYAGMELTSVEVFINELVEGYTLKIYGEGDYDYEPGDLLAEQVFFPNEASWHTITLDTPITITGEDIWVGYELDQQGTDIFPAGTDDGPADPNGNWIKTGIAWGHLSHDYNWNIRAHLTGDVITQWLSVDPTSGIVVPGESTDITVTFDATDLEIGSYSAKIQVNSNAPTTPLIEVPVMLGVIVGIDEAEDNTAIMIYPNPAADYLNINSNKEIQTIRMTNYVGQVVFNRSVNNELIKINTSDYRAGIYFIQITTVDGIITKQIVIK